MRRNIDQRLTAIENRTLDWATQLDTIDYGVLDDYTGDEWEELHFDSTITVVRHKETNEIRGYYRDRRTDAEILGEGLSLEYL